MDYKNNGGSKVIIIGLTDSDEKVCAASGRISTQPGSAMDIWEKSQDKEKNANLISIVTRSGHNSTVEHAYYNLAFENVSVMVEQFMIEFRLASFTVKSRRYVDFSEVGYYSPDFSDDALNKEFCEHIEYLFKEYQNFVDAGIPKEDARFVLPYCFRSNFFCSLNARELLHVLHAMLHGRGSEYKEIYNLGKQLAEQVEKLTPGVMIDFEKRVPSLSDKIDLSFIDAEETEFKNTNTELLAYTPDAETVIAKNALITETQLSADKIEKLLENEEIKSKTIEAVINSSRPRPLEAASFTFRINNVSLATITHFARHRIQSLSVPSLKYSNRENYIIPDTIKENPELLEKYKLTFEKTAALYKKFLSSNISEEDAVYLLLAGNTLDLVLTMNARELLLFFKLRTCTRAQWEIQIYANEMLSKLREISPAVFRHFGPSCYTTGKCPEGKLTCGRALEMQEKFKI